jgi:alpha-L-rhamnosidase
VAGNGKPLTSLESVIFDTRLKAVSSLMNIPRIITLAVVMATVVPFWRSVEASASLQQREPRGAALSALDLRCEYLSNPLGIDARAPRLSWKLVATRTDAKNLSQSAYQIVVASTEISLGQDHGDLWDTGKVVTDQSLHVAYGGKPLTSHGVCWWKVRVWDQDGNESAWSQPAHWTMGLLEARDWSARWIGWDSGDETDKKIAGSNHRRLPARLVRREFKVSKEVRRAIAYVSGLGFFELYMNGEKVGDRLMDPALTGYDRRACYVTFDVTRTVRQGENAIGVILGNGRYFAPRKDVPVPMTTYGYPKLLLQLRLEYSDNSVENVVSDSAWRLSASGPIRANNEYDGEEYDARREMPGWSLPGFDDSGWRNADLVKPPGGALEAQMLEPIRVVEVLKPVAMTNPRPGTFLVDFGQSFYGSVRLKVSGPAGKEVSLRTSFNVTPEGLLNAANDRSARNLDIYVLKGQGVETWHPSFKANATRYVQVEGFPGTPTADNFEGLVTHTDMEPVGQFTCSNALINRIYQNARWGTRMQNRSVPMEPDRDERMPWSGHPAKTSESEGFVFNVARFYDHFLHNYRTHQGVDGSLQEILPPYWTFNSKDIIWPSVITVIPEWSYNFYGDSRILADNFDCMKRWVLFQQEAYQKTDSTIDYCNYGDWVDQSWIKGTHDKRTTSRPLMSTAYYYNNCRIVARAARLLGKAGDAKQFGDLAERVKAGFNARFFNPKTNKYESETQASYVFPLAFGLVPEDHRSAVVTNLIDEIEIKCQGHTSVGLVGMQWFMQTLTNIGHPEVAYGVASQTTRPSWGYMVSKGATTIWERWDTDIQDGGMNGESQKILSGNFEAWVYQTLGGINYDPEKPGFKHIVLRPRPVGDLSFVRASHRSLYGPIVSEWTKKGGAFEWTFAVPPNTTATVYVPAKNGASVTDGNKPAAQAEGVRFLRLEEGSAVFSVGSGTYSFRAPS